MDITCPECGGLGVPAFGYNNCDVCSGSGRLDAGIDPLIGIVHNTDCLHGMAGLPENSIDAIVTDPPYGLSFMGKKWDYDVPQVPVFKEMLRVLKPGGHLLCFGGSRTFHRIAVNIEDAGFDIRDTLMWLYGSGFPKSHDVSKGIDKQKGCFVAGEITANSRAGIEGDENGFDHSKVTRSANPQSEEARKWYGWGTALKPAHEPIIMARKPLEGTVAANVLEHGTGGINIDGCRVGTEELIYGPMKQHMEARPWSEAQAKGERDKPEPKTVTGRWPANVIHDGSEEVLQAFPEAQGQQGASVEDGEEQGNAIYGAMKRGGPHHIPREENTKSAARFFYCAKTSKADRNEGCEGMEEKAMCDINKMGGASCSMKTGSGNDRNPNKQNHHPTVKPTALMVYLCRLITPPNGIVLDPYSGSGSTGKAATLEGLRFIGMEREAEYCTIANKRITWAAKERVETAKKRIEAECNQLKLF